MVETDLERGLNNEKNPHRGNWTFCVQDFVPPEIVTTSHIDPKWFVNPVLVRLVEHLQQNWKDRIVYK